MSAPGSKSLYVHESLLDAAKHRWEEMRTQIATSQLITPFGSQELL
jgi:hypothetical protein